MLNLRINACNGSRGHASSPHGHQIRLSKASPRSTPTRHDFATALLNALRDAADALVPPVPAVTPASDLHLSSDQEFPSLGTPASNEPPQARPKPAAPERPPEPRPNKPKRKIQPSRVTDVRKDAPFIEAPVQRQPTTPAQQPRVRRPQ